MFYLENFDKFNNNFRAARDVPCNNINMRKHISQSIDDRLVLKKMLKAWSFSESHKTQELAKKIAAKIYCEIIKIEYKIDDSIIKKGKTYTIGDIKVPYGLSKMRIFFINLYRRLFYLEYGGGGFLRRISQKTMFSFRWLIHILFNYKSY
jgi:hypothetical protein